MQKKNRFLSILKDKSGASFIFVIGIMLLLMAIGISVLVAASANTGFVIKQKEHNQIMILEDSVHKNIMYSLQYDASDDGLLSKQLVKAMYEANDPDLAGSYRTTGLADISLEVNINNGINLKSGNIFVESITLSFSEQKVIITPPVPAVYEDIYDDEENVIGEALVCDREPQTATVDAAMTATVEINAKGKIVTTRAVYQYTGGMFSDDPEGNHSGDASSDRFEMVFTEYGKWRLIKHENIDSTD